MHAEGLPYQALADRTGLSLGAIKMFFKRNKEPTPSSRCEYCHKPLRQDVVRVGRRFCSDKCRLKWWSVHPEKMTGHHYRCMSCGKEFYSRKPGKYCSRACYYTSLTGGKRK